MRSLRRVCLETPLLGCVSLKLQRDLMTMNWTCRRTVTWSGSSRGRNCGWTTSTKVARCQYRSTWFRHPSRCATRGAGWATCVGTTTTTAIDYIPANDRPSSR